METNVLDNAFNDLIGLYLQIHSKIMELPWPIMTKLDLITAKRQIDLLSNYKCVLFHNNEIQLDEEHGRYNIDKQWTEAKTQIFHHVYDQQDQKIKIDTWAIDDKLKLLQTTAMRIIELAAATSIPDNLQAKISIYKLLQKVSSIRCSLFHYNAQTLIRPHAHSEQYFGKIYYKLHQLSLYFTQR